MVASCSATIWSLTSRSGRRPLLLALKHFVHPTQVGLVAFPGADEILARHLGRVGGQEQHTALVVLDLLHHFAQLAHQRVGQGQRQLEGDESLRQFAAQLDHGLVVGAVLGIGTLELGVAVGQHLHAARDFLRIRAGRAGFLGLVGDRGVVFLVLGFAVVGDHHRRRRLGHFLHQIVEADHDLGQALFAGLVQFVILQQQLDRPREIAQRRLHLAQAFLDALGDGDFAFAGQQLHGTHLAHVHAHGVGGAAAFGVEGQRRGGFLGGGVVDFAIAGAVAGEQQGFDIGRDFMHLDAHAVDHADDVFDLLGVDDVVRQVIVDFGKGQVALFQALADQQLDIGLLGRTFVGHGCLRHRQLRGREPGIIQAGTG